MKSEEQRKGINEGKKGDIAERCVSYSLKIINLYNKLEKNSVGRIIGKQLLRSATSIGANVHEAQAAQSKADFRAKMSIAHKKARESSYWLRLIHEAKILAIGNMNGIMDETQQIIRMISSILLTSKKRKGDQ